jgi:hypothetical protein
VSESELRNSASLWIWPGPKATSTNGKAVEHLLLHRLGPAAADTHRAARVFALQPLRLAQVGDEATVGRLADRAGVEEDQVGFGPLRRLLVAEGGEHAPHPLGVMHVHLAPEGGDVKALHALRVQAPGSAAKE